MNKRGVSIVIGYILLIGVVIALSAVVYTWLRSYVPKQALECPDSVSVSIPDFSYNCSGTTNNTLNFTVENSGTFSVAGYFVHATNTSEALATIDLSPYYNGTGTAKDTGGVVKFSKLSTDLNSLKPGKSVTMSQNGFIIPVYSAPLTKIVITPVRYVTYNGQSSFSSCGNAEISEAIRCTS